MRVWLVLAVLISGMATEVFAADVSNFAANIYTYRASGPSAPPSSPAVPTITPNDPRVAMLPPPDNGVCVGLCRLFDVIWRLERLGQIALMPDRLSLSETRSGLMN